MYIYSLNEEDLEIFESLKTFTYDANYELLPINKGEFNPFYGKHHSEETKQKLSEYAKLRVGESNPNYGNYWTDEQKQIISNIHKDKTLSDEHKLKLSLIFSGENNPQYGKIGELSPNYGKTHTEETKHKISAALSGRTLSSEHRQNISNTKQNMSGENHPNFGKKYNMTITTCPHCGKTGSQNMKRYHFENCKWCPVGIPTS